ncbi:hypothetical protein EAMG_04979 [Escherichia coli M056]|nr:hypothetical protein EAMG_04979 [Escherichia coli M056]
MQKCKNAKMQKCKNAKMQKCKNAKIIILCVDFNKNSEVA